MSLSPEVTTASPATSPAEAPVRKPDRTQERVMLWLSLAFFGGIGVYMVLPEGALRGLGMTAVSLLMIWALFQGTQDRR